MTETPKAKLETEYPCMGYIYSFSEISTFREKLAELDEGEQRIGYLLGTPYLFKLVNDQEGYEPALKIAEIPHDWNGEDLHGVRWQLAEDHKNIKGYITNLRIKFKDPLLEIQRGFRELNALGSIGSNSNKKQPSKSNERLTIGREIIKYIGEILTVYSVHSTDELDERNGIFIHIKGVIEQPIKAKKIAHSIAGILRGGYRQAFDVNGNSVLTFRKTGGEVKAILEEVVNNASDLTDQQTQLLVGRGVVSTIASIGDLEEIQLIVGVEHIESPRNSVSDAYQIQLLVFRKK